MHTFVHPFANGQLHKKVRAKSEDAKNRFQFFKARLTWKLKIHLKTTGLGEALSTEHRLLSKHQTLNIKITTLRNILALSFSSKTIISAQYRIIMPASFNAPSQQPPSSKPNSSPSQKANFRKPSNQEPSSTFSEKASTRG